MEGNKDEAIRAKQIAENMMQINEFEGARRILLKAKYLYPELENIGQMLSVCDIHCSAQRKIGSEKDWYGILQVEKKADELIVKKQYRRLALILHPDKNGFPGAEAAFKLICEANTVLSDPTKRSLYDSKIRVLNASATVNPPHHMKRNSQNGYRGSNQCQSTLPNLWTSCPFCCATYQYNRKFVTTAFQCLKCLKHFIADEKTSRGVPLVPTWAPAKTTVQSASATKVNGGSKSKEKGNCNGNGKRRERADTKNKSSKRSRKHLVKDEDANCDLDDSDKGVYQCPDPEFNDFDKDRDESCFAVDQFWACYDPVDSMPRYYAKVKKVSSPFQLTITWLEAIPVDGTCKEWIDEGLPVGCGSFKLGETEKTSLRFSFSHQVYFYKGNKRGSLVIHPRRGEVWALFKDWDLSWSSNPEKHREYKYEIVEVLSDSIASDGVKVCKLDKVGGFVSLFERSSSQSVTNLFLIRPNELCRFSHRIPCCKMAGTERDGVPVGSFELDPASLPLKLDVLH